MKGYEYNSTPETFFKSGNRKKKPQSRKKETERLMQPSACDPINMKPGVGFYCFAYVPERKKRLVLCTFYGIQKLMPFASRGKSNLSPNLSEATAAAKPPPAKRDAKRPIFPLKGSFLLKKAEKPFAFSPTACTLCFGIAFLTNGNPVSSSFQPYFNQKYTKTDQVCN